MLHRPKCVDQFWRKLRYIEHEQRQKKKNTYKSYPMSTAITYVTDVLVEEKEKTNSFVLQINGTDGDDALSFWIQAFVELLMHRMFLNQNLLRMFKYHQIVVVGFSESTMFNNYITSLQIRFYCVGKSHSQKSLRLFNTLTCSMLTFHCSHLITAENKKLKKCNDLRIENFKSVVDAKTAFRKKK